MDEFLTLRRALHLGYGLDSNESLERLCSLIWAVSKEDQKVLAYHFKDAIRAAASIRSARTGQKKHYKLSGRRKPQSHKRKPKPPTSKEKNKAGTNINQPRSSPTPTPAPSKDGESDTKIDSSSTSFGQEPPGEQVLSHKIGRFKTRLVFGWHPNATLTRWLNICRYRTRNEAELALSSPYGSLWSSNGNRPTCHSAANSS